jgi:hypothetical protein
MFLRNALACTCKSANYYYAVPISLCLSTIKMEATCSSETSVFMLVNVLVTPTLFLAGEMLLRNVCTCTYKSASYHCDIHISVSFHHEDGEDMILRNVGATSHKTAFYTGITR